MKKFDWVERWNESVELLKKEDPMGEGIEAARAMGSTVHADVMENLKEQLLIVFLKRLGGKISIPVAEVDDTGQDGLTLSVIDGIFNFEVFKKD